MEFHKHGIYFFSPWLRKVGFAFLRRFAKGYLEP